MAQQYASGTSALQAMAQVKTQRLAATRTAIEAQLGRRCGPTKIGRPKKQKSE